MLKIDKKSKSFILILLITVVFQGCVPEGLMMTWRSEQAYDNHFKKVMVLGLVNDVTVRNNLENDVVDAADKFGLITVNGLSMFPPELGKPFEDVERFKNRLKGEGFDGIITVALIDVKAERYVESSAQYEPLVYYDRFRNYYFRTYDLVYRSGYFAQYSRYFIESNFYELKEGKLVWSGRSKVFDPSEFNSYSPVYARGLFKELELENVITKN